jgi:hypothetical protein
MKSKVPQTLAAEYADRRRCETEYKVRMPRLKYRRGGMWHTVYYAYLDGFAAGKDSSEPVAEEPAPGWIHVDTRYPPEEEDVLCYTVLRKTGTVFAEPVFVVASYKAGLWRTGRDIYSGTFVTHWMPLPHPPEKV